MVSMAPHNFDQQNLRKDNGLYDVISTIVAGDFHGFIEEIVGNTYGISRALFLGTIFCGLWMALWKMIPGLPLFALGWLIGTMPIWIVPACMASAWTWWMWYVHSWHEHSKHKILLEIKIPNSIVKSPRAMEAVFAHLDLGGQDNTFINRLWNGGFPPRFSFEIVSFGGDVHFYVWTWRVFKRSVEEALYAQYPELEIIEVEDYAMAFTYDPEKTKAVCWDWRLEPKNDAYPFKTYVDWELEDEVDEEYKIDPFAQVMETMSSMSPTEQGWVQIIITKNKDKAPGKRWFDTGDRFGQWVHEAVDKIRKETVLGAHPEPGDEKWRATAARLEQFHVGEVLRSIERNASKPHFNVGMRGTYMVSPTNTFSNAGFNNFRFMWRPFADEKYRNYIRHRRWHPPLDYAYQDLWDIRFNIIAKRFFDCYRRRGHFQPPWIFPHNTWSVEMLASVWHPPSRGVEAHGLERISSKKKEAPHNLPM